MDSSIPPTATVSGGQLTPLVFHWIMTIQLLSGVIETHDGLHTWDRPTPPTRSVMFNSIVSAVMDRYGVERLAVLEYSLELNDMSAIVR